MLHASPPYLHKVSNYGIIRYMITIDTTPMPNKRIKGLPRATLRTSYHFAYAGKNKSGGTLWRCTCDC